MLDDLAMLVSLALGKWTVYEITRWFVQLDKK